MMNNRQMSEARASSFYGDEKRLEIPTWRRRKGDDGTAGAVVVNRPKRPTRPGAIALNVA